MFSFFVELLWFFVWLKMICGGNEIFGSFGDYGINGLLMLKGDCHWNDWKNVSK